MIHKWEFEDGTTLRWTQQGSVLVDGNSPLADELRKGTRFPFHFVEVGLHPGGTVGLDLKNIWLMNKFCEQKAWRLKLEVVSSTYTPSDEDIPPDALEIIERDNHWIKTKKGKGNPNTIY